METYRDVHGFFRERLLQALADLDMHATEPTEYYLVNLLSSFATADRIQELHTPFADSLTQAYSTRGIERAARLRGIGDSALFLSGFLADSMDRRGVTHTYCLAIGQRAYGEAGQQFFDAGPGSDVLLDLARRFTAFVRVLDEVREQTTHRTDGELLGLYERWMMSGSTELLRRLSRHGVIALRSDIDA
jgi:hypothetical protein